MSVEITLVRCQDWSLRPVCEYDHDLVRTWKVGQAVKVRATKLHARSLEHHRLYFGGLLKLAFGRRMLQGLPPYAVSRRVGGVVQAV